MSLKSRKTKTTEISKIQAIQRDVPAYVIVQKLNGRVYTYRETAEHFESAEKHRRDDGCQRLDPMLLGIECDLSVYADNTYFVFPLQP